MSQVYVTLRKSGGILQGLQRWCKSELVYWSLRCLGRWAYALVIIPRFNSEARITAVQRCRCNLSDDQEEYILYEAADLVAAQSDVVAEAYDILTDNDNDDGI